MSKNKGTHGRGKESVEEPDEFVQRVSSFADIIGPHIPKLVIAGVVAMGGLIAWKVMSWRHVEAATDATTAYVSAMKSVEAPVVGPDDPPLPDSPVKRTVFSSDDARRTASLEALAKVSADHGGLALSSLAGLRRARLLLDGDKFDDALADYKKFSKSMTLDPLRMSALEAVAYSLEAKALANKDPSAAQAGLESALQSFASLQPTPGGPMRDYSLYHQGRMLVALGRSKEAVDMFKKVLQENPDTSLKSNIDQRLADLESSAGSQPEATGKKPDTVPSPAPKGGEEPDSAAK